MSATILSTLFGKNLFEFSFGKTFCRGSLTNSIAEGLKLSQTFATHSLIIGDGEDYRDLSVVITYDDGAIFDLVEDS